MNLTVFKRVSVGEFVTYMGMLIGALPSCFASEKEDLRRACGEIEHRLNADRRNHTLRELKEECMPRLRFLLNTLEGELRFCRRRNENEESMLKYLRTSFKARKCIERMVGEAMVLCRFDAPEDEHCRSVFERIVALVEEMDAMLRRKGEEDARICAIGRCIPVRNEAMKVLQRIRTRAVAYSYEEERREMAEDVINALESLIAMGERTVRKKGEGNDTPHVASLHTGLPKESPLCGG